MRVSNAGESVLSLPATLRVSDGISGGGAVSFQNRFVSGGSVTIVSVYDVDGSTKLSGSEFVAQLYAGPSMAELTSVGRPVPFGTGPLAGSFRGSTLTLPTVTAGATAQLQVRVWQAQVGASYEEARALGGKFGKSEVFQSVASEGFQIPPALVDLKSFSLQAGLPHLNVGVIRLVNVEADGHSTWRLLGEKGFRYVIEQSEGDFSWRPFGILTNSTGEVFFEDQIPKGASGQRFYRSRILD